MNSWESSHKLAGKIFFGFNRSINCSFHALLAKM